jgi:OOP family OmpA-OmpF porin
MKKTVKLGIAIVSLSVLTGSSFAANPGTYLGLGLGASRIQSEDKNIIEGPGIRSSHTLGGLGGRVFAGYNFNRYFGAELGVARYAPSKYDSNSTDGNGAVSLKYNMNAIDLVGKAYLPIGESGFNAYALGGVARVNSKQKADVTFDGAKSSYSETTNKFRPIYGLGVSYDVSNSVTTNAEFTQIKGNGKSSSVPTANMLTLNVAYNLG